MARWILAWSFFPLSEEKYKLPSHVICIKREALRDLLQKPPYCFSVICLDSNMMQVTVPQSKMHCWTRSARRAKRAYSLVDQCDEGFHFWILDDDINALSICLLPKQFSHTSEHVFTSLCNHLQKIIVYL